MPTGSPDWSGNRLVHGVNAIVTQGTVAVAGGQVISPATYDIARPGYVVRLDANSGVTPCTVPFVLVEFVWRDPTNNVRLGHESWTIPVTLSGVTYRVMGKGPTKGSKLFVQYTNLDPAVTVNVTATIIETTQHINRDDWRGIDTAAVPTFVTATDSMAMGVLESEVLAIAVSSGQTRLLPLYCGQAAMTVQVNPSNALQQLVFVRKSSDNAPIFAGSATPGSSLSQTLVDFPREPCLLVVQNTSATVASSVTVTMPLIEYAS